MPIPREIIDHALGTPAGQAAVEIAEKLQQAGHECFWVGGAPRDMLLGRMPGDIDMATSAKPTEVVKLFPKCDETHADLGSIVVAKGGFETEITTFRSDHPMGDGRRPLSVTFGGKEADALRRDATVNAIYWNPVSGELFDPTGGEEDLKERLVRFIGDPDHRIKEDALRILRMVRLRSSIEGQYYPETFSALKTNAYRAAMLSGTRVLEELEKVLQLKKPSKVFRDLLELQILEHVLPEISACRGVAQPVEYHTEGDVFDHLMRCVDSFTDDHKADVRIAALFHDVGKAVTFAVKERIRFDHHAEASSKLAAEAFARLQMTGARSGKICWIITHHMMMGTFQDLSDERKAHWYFHPWFQELLQLFWLDIAGTVPSDFRLYESIVRDYDEFLNSHPRPEKPLLDGKEIMALLGLKPGEEVGKAIQALHDAQIRKEVTTKAEAKKFLQSRGI